MANYRGRVSTLRFRSGCIDEKRKLIGGRSPRRNRCDDKVGELLNPFLKRARHRLERRSYKQLLRLETQREFAELEDELLKELIPEEDGKLEFEFFSTKEEIKEPAWFEEEDPYF